MKTKSKKFEVGDLVYDRIPFDFWLIIGGEQNCYSVYQLSTGQCIENVYYEYIDEYFYKFEGEQK